MAANGGGKAVTVSVLLTALPLLTAGAIMLGFAQVIEHLADINKSSREQADALKALIEQRITNDQA